MKQTEIDVGAQNISAQRRHRSRKSVVSFEEQESWRDDVVLLIEAVYACVEPEVERLTVAGIRSIPPCESRDESVDLFRRPDEITRLKDVRARNRRHGIDSICGPHVEPARRRCKNEIRC